jgi:hypothetical protein
MYLQMYPVMISFGELSQGKYCGRTISYARRYPGARLTNPVRRNFVTADADNTITTTIG